MEITKEISIKNTDDVFARIDSDIKWNMAMAEFDWEKCLHLSPQAVF